MRVRMTHALALVLVVIGSVLAPSGARAQEDAAALGAPGEVPAPVSIELSVGVTPMLGLGGLGSTGGLGLGLAPSADLAIGIDPRIALVIGGSVHASEQWVSAQIPLLVQAYLAEPRLGSLVPTVRAGVVGIYSGEGGLAAYGGGVRASGGVTWLAARWIALRLEVGGAITAYHFEHDRTVMIGGALDARGSVVLRL